MSQLLLSSPGWPLALADEVAAGHPEVGNASAWAGALVRRMAATEVAALRLAVLPGGLPMTLPSDVLRGTQADTDRPVAGSRRRREGGRANAGQHRGGPGDGRASADPLEHSAARNVVLGLPLLHPSSFRLKVVRITHSLPGGGDPRHPRFA